MKKAKISGFFAAMLVLALGTSAFAVELVPGGMTVGLELHCSGVMVTRIVDVDTHEGKRSPAREAGLEAGDCIIRFAGADIGCGEDFMKKAAELSGSDVSVTIMRKGEERTLKVTPAQNKSGQWQLGLWLKDGASGIGTVTYYNPQSGKYGALGHGVNDMDSGLLIPAEDGKVSPSEVVDVVPGKAGKPGELCGVFDPEEVLGDIDANTPYGIFGDMDSFSGEMTVMETASADEIKTGRATILSNVKGTEVEEYDIELLRVNCAARDGRNFVIKICDERLLSHTGGVVCGMSGSPIIQNGKLIGAVTHVLVNDPTRGYGIFIENMLSASKDAA